MVSPRLAGSAVPVSKKPIPDDNPFKLVDESIGSQEIVEESKSSHASDRLALRKSRTINFNFGSVGSVQSVGSQSVDVSASKDKKLGKFSSQNNKASPLIIVEEEAE